MVELFEGFAIVKAKGLGQLLIVGHGVALGGKVLDLFAFLFLLALLAVGIIVEVDAQRLGKSAQIGLNVVLDVGDIGVVGGLVGPFNFIVAVRVGGSSGEALAGGGRAAGAGSSGGGTLDEGEDEGGEGELHLDDSFCVVFMLDQTEL